MVIQMNKRELAKVYVKMSPKNISIVQAVKEIEEFLETVKEAIALDGEVRFPKRGAFEILTRKPRVVANPVTRERMTVYPKKTVKFRASKKIK
jgi:nucleoid DNA-binding protein